MLLRSNVLDHKNLSLNTNFTSPKISKNYRNLMSLNQLQGWNYRYTG